MAHPILFSLRSPAKIRYAPARHFSSSLIQLNKPPIALIAALRKSHPVPLNVARDALTRSNNDLSAALQYLKSTTSASSEAKAKKLSSRTTDEGTIAISLLGGKRVGMIHLACETDFVARNQVFIKTAKGVAETTAFLDVPSLGDELPSSIPNPTSSDPILDFPISALSSAPLIHIPESSSSEHPEPISHSSEPQTIHQTLLSSLSQTGENLRLMRAVSFAAPFPSTPEVRFIPGGYAHGGSSDREGKVGGIIVLKVESLDEEKPIVRMLSSSGGKELEEGLATLARTVARQVVGFPTKALDKGGKDLSAEEVLLEQPGMMFGSEQNVRDVIDAWGKERGLSVKIVGMRRWSVEDDLESGVE